MSKFTTFWQKTVQICLLCLFVFQSLQAEMPLVIWALQDQQSLLENCVNKDKPKSCCVGRCQRDKSIASALSVESTNVKIEKPILKILLIDPYEAIAPSLFIPNGPSFFVLNHQQHLLGQRPSPPIPPPRT